MTRAALRRVLAAASVGVALATVSLALPTLSVAAGASPVVTPLGDFGYGLITTGANGNAYAANYYDGEVYQIAPDGTVTSFAAVPFAWAITSDAQGNLYVNDWEDCVIDKVTPSGVVSEYASGEGTCGLYGMVVDPTTGVLYVSNSSGYIFAVATNGTVSLFASSNGGYGLARDAQGNLYTANPASSTVYKVDHAGTETTFATGLGAPRGLAMGPSGTLYVASESGHDVLAVSPAGVVSVAVPSSALVNNSYVAAVAVSAAGVMYVSDWDSDEVWRVDGVEAPLAITSLMVSSTNEQFGGSLHQALSASWAASAGASSYTCTLMYAYNDPSSFTMTTTSPSCVFEGLDLTTEYGISVVANNGAAASPPVTAFAAPTPVPVTTPVTHSNVRTIVCEKNHTQRLRVITRVNPRCPMGWHRVA